MTTWTRIGDASDQYAIWIFDENSNPIYDESGDIILSEQSVPVPSNFTVWTKIYI